MEKHFLNFLENTHQLYYDQNILQKILHEQGHLKTDRKLLGIPFIVIKLTKYELA